MKYTTWPHEGALAFGVLGDIFHTPHKGAFEYIAHAFLGIDHDGKIITLLDPKDEHYQDGIDYCKSHGLLKWLKPGQYLIPGLVDLHCHAPQFPQMGKGMDLGLYDWLHRYTFKLEARYQDLDFAHKIYESLVRCTLANGTTSAVYFGSLHLEPSKLLATICHNLGQRALVGKVCMDEADQCPDYYRHSTQDNLKDTQVLHEHIEALEGDLVHHVVTPRFVPSCTWELLRDLGAFATTHNTYVQTHCSESDWARDYSQAKYQQTDAQIYAKAGLLGAKSILAHCIFLSPDDVALIKEAKALIAHCPQSNIYFANAAMRTRELLDNNLPIGLGSDIAASVSPSIFRACFDAVSHSRAREEGTSAKISASLRGENDARISFLEAFYMATAGGGEALGLKVGAFKCGYGFDALVIDATKSDTDLAIYKVLDTPQDILEKIICTASRANIDSVWVQGRCVKGSI